MSNRSRSERTPGRTAMMALLGLVAALPVAALTPIGGPVATNQALLVSSSPYLVTSDLVVQNGATLSIQPGVTVYVASGVNIVVQAGALRLDGTETAPVTITSESDLVPGAAAPGDWGLLRFENGTNDAGTRLKWAVLRYGTGVQMTGASPSLDDVRIESMSGAAISIDLASFPSGFRNSATGCGENAIVVPAGDITAPGGWALRGIPYLVRGRVSVGQSPRIASIAPTTVQRLDTVDVTVQGQRLNGATSFVVDGGGVTATILPGGTATQLVARLQVAQDAALGARAFRAVMPAGLAESSDAGLSLTVAPAVPVLDAINPSSAVAGSGSFTLTANGRRFDLGAEIVVGATPLVTTRISSTQLTGTVPASLVATAGNLDVVVRNPDPVTPGAFLVSSARTLRVDPPQITLAPDPLLVIAGQTANLVLSLPYTAPSGGLVFNLLSANTAVASVPSQVTVPFGSASVPITVTGGTTGSTTITASRAGFLSDTATIDVVPPPILIPITPLVAPRVGVQVGPPPEPPSGDVVVTPLPVAPLGVAVGPVLVSIAPDLVPQGSAGTVVTATGQGLDAVIAAIVEPSDGLTLSAPTNVAPDGSSLQFTVGAAADAPPTLRRVLLQTATGYVRAASTSADRLLVTRGTPEITSIAPIEVVPGSIVAFLVRGRNLHDASLIGATPPDGLIFSTPPVVNAEGTEVSMSLQVLGSAPLGDRTIRLTNPGGTSSAVASAANTLHVVAALGTTFTPLVARPVGVVIPTPPGPEPDFVVSPATARRVGVVLGAAVTGVVPSSANVATANLSVTIEGSGLADVTGVAFDPPDGITINGSPVVAGDGTSVTLDVTIAADAPTVMRFVRVTAPAGLVPAASAEANRFLVTLPPPVITGLSPIRGVVGQTVLLTIHGRELAGATQVVFEPATGAAIQNPPTVAADGLSAAVNVILDAAAPLGPRVVRITTPGGQSTATGSPANTFEVTDQVGTTFMPLAARPVGVVIPTPPQPEPDFVVTPLAAAPVGVVIPTPPMPEPDFVVTPQFGAPVGVLVGSAVTGSSPRAATPGTASLDVTLTGVGLDVVTGIDLQPATGVTINGAPSIAPDGTSLTVNLSIALDAPRGDRRVMALTASGRLPAIRPGIDLLFIGNPPAITSIVPNVVAIGSAFTLTVNGTEFDASAIVSLLPPEGATIGPATVAAGGTQLTVPIALAGSITPGARIVTVTTTAGTSSTSATPANTLTIVGGLAPESASAAEAARESEDSGPPPEVAAALPRSDAGSRDDPARLVAGEREPPGAIIPIVRRVEPSPIEGEAIDGPAVRPTAREGHTASATPTFDPVRVLTPTRLARPPTPLASERSAVSENDLKARRIRS